MSDKQDIGDLLVENGQITEKQLQDAREQRENITEPIGTVLLRLGLVNEENIKTILELHYGVNYVDLKKISPEPNLIQLLPQKVILQHDIVPVQENGGRVLLAMVNPSDKLAFDKAKQYLSGKRLQLVVCSDDGFQNFVNRAYAIKSVLQATSDEGKTQTDVIASSGEHSEKERELPAKKVDRNQVLVLLTRHIVSNAINKGCSNIHIEPGDRQVLVHYRKDGVLFPVRKLPKTIWPELVTRFKAMTATRANWGILPYDGLLNMRREHDEFTLRLSVVRGEFGEHMVIWLE